MMPAIDPTDIYPAYDKKRQQSSRLRRMLYRLSPLPLHALHPLIFEARMQLVRLRSRSVSRAFKEASDLLVNIGPGDQARDGWINVDIFDGAKINCVYDCRKKLPFPDGSVRGIFSEHVFEHIDYTEEVPHFVAECHRVLKKRGVLRLIVPDAGRYLRAYCDGDWKALAGIRDLDADHVDPYTGGKYATRMELINVVFRQGFEHKFAYDYETLAHVLQRYGFESVTHQQCGQSAMPELAIDQPSRAPESLYVDAIK